ncbi:hypothetical protein [Luteibacter sp. UNCMF366Tsu5.1]|uniref:hypothetical protein n=1 Tax=Luteibacter sp. UNCMF366Tsu5.1 TaxID=1502758 RepID=UPI000908D63F|nr:hypothetical protein [Luteibacter sp. UNCMF366Tsu5.1]SFW54101.1 hypothetical protein SAMN02800691_2012 [Luteibacter sp. UNCMF366Tsu5.1]
MGASVGWFAVKGKGRDEVFAALDLVRNERTASHPGTGYSLALPNGWFAVVTRFESPLIADADMRRLSHGCVVITCEYDDHVMVSSSTCYVNGLRNWRAEHDGQHDDNRHLATSGSLPAAFDAIHARIETMQDAADTDGDDVDHYYSLPIELAQSVTTFHADLPASAYGATLCEGWTLVEATAVPAADPDLPRKVRKAVAKATRPWWKLW